MYFNGANKEGYFFVGATARRHEKLTQTLLYIRVTLINVLNSRGSRNSLDGWLEGISCSNSV